MKTALLIVSFGTTHPDAIEKTIAATEAAIGAAFPGYPVYRAFTNRIIRTRLKGRYGIAADDVAEALVRMTSDGVTHVILQPTLVIPGGEYEALCAAVEANRGGLQISVGKPLLYEESDLDAVLSAVQLAYPVDRETVLLLAGHGTDHSAARIYERLLEKMRGTSLHLCTVKGEPSFADAAEELAGMGVEKVLAVPLLFVAGDHAKKDMAGDGPDSLRSILEARGLCVSCEIRGLGEIPTVRQMYVRKARKAADSLT